MNSFSVILLISDAVAFCLNRIFSLHYPLFVTSTDDDLVKIQRDFGKNGFESNFLLFDWLLFCFFQFELACLVCGLYQWFLFFCLESFCFSYFVFFLFWNYCPDNSDFNMFTCYWECMKKFSVFLLRSVAWSFRRLLQKNCGTRPWNSPNRPLHLNIFFILSYPLITFFQQKNFSPD